MSVVRVLAGQVGDGTTLNSQDRDAGRVSGVFKMMGQAFEKRGAAAAGETVAFGKLDHAKTGDTLASGKDNPKRLARDCPLSAGARDLDRREGAQGRREARSGAEQAGGGRPLDHHRAQSRYPRGHPVGAGRDASAGRDRAAHRPLRHRASRSGSRASAIARPSRRRSSSAAATRSSPAATASSAMSCSTSSRCRAGSGFKFAEKITGGVVPRNYIPSVEEGVIDGLKHGPLGFPVVDISVTLIDGSYHTVDSSDQAFRTAGRIGVVEALPQCHPVLLEPIHLGRDRLPERCDREDQRHPVGTARADPRLRHARRLVRLGQCESNDAGIGNRRPDRRGPLGDRGRRHASPSSSTTWPN